MAGASEGLGAAFAAQLAERGMNLVLVARRGHLLAELGERLAAEHGVVVRCLGLDLAGHVRSPGRWRTPPAVWTSGC